MLIACPLVAMKRPAEQPSAPEPEMAAKSSGKKQRPERKKVSRSQIEAQVKRLKEQAERGEIPNELLLQTFKDLVSVEMEGATEEQKLFNAIAGIRSFMGVFPTFFSDVKTNEYFIDELAKRYAGDDKIKVAIALATAGAGQWLAAAVNDPNHPLYKIKAGYYLVDAASRKELGTVRFILTYAPMVINDKGINESTALMFAAENGDLPMVEVLLKTQGIDINAKNKQGHTALIYAVMNNRLAIVDRLLRIQGAGGTDVNAQNLRPITS